MDEVCRCGIRSGNYSAALAQTAPITLSVDLTDAPRKILHATEVMPVTAGPLTVVYPKWIPGEHGPTGPIENMAGFFITANGQPVKWERDKVDMFAYHLTVPQGVTQLEMKIDFLATAAPSGFSAGGSTSENLALLSWNTLLVYPDGYERERCDVHAFHHDPRWMEVRHRARQRRRLRARLTTFKTVSLEQLVDSPVLAGRYFREIPLAPEITPKHYLDMAADGPEEIDLSKEHIAEFDRLVRETGALYKSRHYGSYHFLVTLSDEVAHFGLEHHQSSDDRVAPRTFIDDQEFILDGLLLPHEFTHSWNGKYRRPAGLATSNYQKPMEGDLLWVYEGLTEYLGDVLAARCGIWTPEQYKQRLSTIAADVRQPSRPHMAQYPGHRHRRPDPLRRRRRMGQLAAQRRLLRRGRTDLARRRHHHPQDDQRQEVASTISSPNSTASAATPRQKSFPTPSKTSSPDLNAVVPNDWATFLRSRLDSNAYQAPLGGLENGGYKLTYSDKPNAWSAMADRRERHLRLLVLARLALRQIGRHLRRPEGRRRGQSRPRPRHEDHRRQRTRLLRPMS